MAHIHTNDDEHDLTVSAYIVKIETNAPKVMLHMHKKLKMWLQFGGHVELNENPWQALTHEVLEESGYKMSQLQLLQPPQRFVPQSKGVAWHPQPLAVNTHQIGDTKHFHTDLAYGFVTDQKPQLSPQQGESGTVGLFSIDEISSNSVDLSPATKELVSFVLNDAYQSWDRIRLS
ncbi:TPA: hypothetical protein EYO12_03365 [Candidatus Saccharibacteria bacterium]|nr:hypothetical protein [Candidatus Saccharibacteria bacterium]HIO87928.1 hypothetical protein [Candidatus Saccharibacteria bacterium]